MMRWRWMTVATLLLSFSVASAHEVRPALLKISEINDGEFLVRWKVPAAGEKQLAVHPVFSTECSTSEDRVNAITAGASLSAWTIHCDEGLEGQTISFTNLPSTMIDVLVRITFLDGRDYTQLIRPTDPVFQVPTRDSEVSIFGNYLALGMSHIWQGWDHLLFVLGLLLLVTNRVRLLWAITGFTLAHSVTLALAVFDVLVIPGAPVEAVIALSIVLLAVEARKYHETEHETLAVRAPWFVSTVIGFIHGLGFAGALSEYGLPAYARIMALFSFNLGVELGQLAFIAAVLSFGGVVGIVNTNLLPPMRLTATWFIGICGSFWLIERLASF